MLNERRRVGTSGRIPAILTHELSLDRAGEQEIHWAVCSGVVYFERRHAMQTVYIKFLTDADRAKGFLELAKRSRIGSLPGQLYQIPLVALQILDEVHVDFRRATDAEVKEAHDQIRDPSAAVL